MSGEPARTLGPYRLLHQLAVGGMAEIYAAQAIGVGGFEKLIALKVIHPNYSADPELVQMLVDEAKLAVQLSHANIVQTFDLGRVDGQYYIAMELIDGVDLYKLLRKASEKDLDFPLEVATFIALEASNGLDYAHRKRDPKGRPLEIVHRDVSPQNILVSHSGEVKLVDFGIAKAALRGQKTAAGVIKGKYYYMSPEQAWGDPIDARTDVFSTGILLYEMLIGQMLYLEEDLDALLARVRKADIPPPSTRRAGLPPELDQLVMKALKKRPVERYQSASELGQALQRYLRTIAPDFSRARLAAFVKDVLGDAPAESRRDPRATTALTRDALARDENSLLFKLADLKPEEDAPPAPATQLKPPPPRARDQATSQLSMPEHLAPSSAGDRRRLSDYDEPDQTIVDPGAAALPAPGGGERAFDDEEEEPTLSNSGPIPALLPRSPSQETAPGVPAPSGLRPLPPLPGVRAQLQPPPGRPPATSARPPSPSSPHLPPLAPLGEREPDGDDDALAELKDERTVQHRRAGRARPSPAAAVLAHAPTLDLRQLTPAPMPEVLDTGSGPTEPHDLPAPTLTLGSTRAPQPAGGFEEPTRIPPHAPPQVTGSQQAWPFASHEDSDLITQPPAWPPPRPSNPESGDSQPAHDLRQTALPKLGRRVAVASGIVLALVATAVGLGLLLARADRTGTVEVVSLPPGAAVRLDDQPIPGKTPLEIPDVDARTPHHVRVALAGYDVWDSDVRFQPSLTSATRLRLQAVLVPAVGTLSLGSTPPGAEAIVNGRIRGLTPVTVGDLPPTEDVVIELRLRGYKVAHKQLGWEGKRQLEVELPLEKAR